MKLLVVAVALFLLLPGRASAHVSVLPGLVSSGSDVLFRIEIPGLRPGFEPTALDLSGPGVRMLSSNRAGGLGEESRWRIRARIETVPGPLPLVLLARYADGRSVTVHQTVTVLPARADGGSGAPIGPIAATLIVLVALGSLLLLLRLRRRSAGR